MVLAGFPQPGITHDVRAAPSQLLYRTGGASALVALRPFVPPCCMLALLEALVASVLYGLIDVYILLLSRCVHLVALHYCTMVSSSSALLISFTSLSALDK